MEGLKLIIHLYPPAPDGFCDFYYISYVFFNQELHFNLKYNIFLCDYSPWLNSHIRVFIGLVHMMVVQAAYQEMTQICESVRAGQNATSAKL